MKVSAWLYQGMVLSAVLGMSACATNKEPSSANQAVNQQRAASSAPYGYACYDDFGQPVYYYDAASPGYCTHRPVYVVQQRPSPVIAPSRTLPPSQRAPLPVPDRIGVLGR